MALSANRIPLNSLGRAFAATLLGLALALPTGLASGQAQGIDRSVIPISPDAPERYVVQRGDTLWDISAKFLSDPWYWPEIWYVNPQVSNPHLIYPGDVLALIWVDGKPQLVLERGGPTRLSPQVREQPLSEAIYAIPYEKVAAFMSKPTVLDKDQVKGAPYVARARDDRLIAATGDKLYVRRLGRGAVGDSYNVYYVGEELRDPEDGKVLGYQGMYNAEVTVQRLGDPASAMVTTSARETLEGDILLPARIEVGMDFIPRSPKRSVDGTIIAVTEGRTVTGEFDVVIINRGTRHGLEPGHVLAIWEAGDKVVDKTPHRESRTMQLPDERTGLFMVFKAYDRMSYGLTLESERPIHVGDAVRNP